MCQRSGPGWDFHLVLKVLSSVLAFRTRCSALSSPLIVAFSSFSGWERELIENASPFIVPVKIPPLMFNAIGVPCGKSSAP